MPERHISADTGADTRFTRLVGCDLPIQQAPIGLPAATPKLAAAVAAAGGHGMLAAVTVAPAALSASLDVLNARTSAYGVNFIQALLDPEAFEVAAAKAPLVELYMGPAHPHLVDRAHRQGALVSRQVVSVDEARSAQAEGCDMVVVRGIEAGGRSTTGIGLLALLDAVCDAVDIPIVAAGGIGSARGVAACLAAGADAVRVGTRFLAAEEAETHPVYLEQLIAAGPHDTVVTDEFSAGIPRTNARVLRSCLEAARAHDGDYVGEMTVGGVRVQAPRFGPHNPALDAAGHVEAMALYAGQGVGSVGRVEPAADIVAELALGVRGAVGAAGGVA